MDSTADSKNSPPMEMLKEILLDIAGEVVDHLQEEKDHRQQTSEYKCYPPTENHRIPLAPLIPQIFVILGNHSKFPIWQLEVLKQRDTVSCGYHSFHNAYLALKGKI